MLLVFFPLYFQEIIFFILNVKTFKHVASYVLRRTYDEIVKGTLKSALFLHANTLRSAGVLHCDSNGSGLTIWDCATSQSDHHRQQRILREECAPMQALTARTWERLIALNRSSTFRRTSHL